MTNEEFNEQSAVRKLLHLIKQEKPYFEPEILRADLSSITAVRVKQSNPRIVAQSGAFLLFGDGASFDEATSDTPPQGEEDALVKVMKINAKDGKARILRELDHLNINERTVYPSLERSAVYISNRLGIYPQLEVESRLAGGSELKLHK